MTSRVAIIGSGISGLSAAHLLNKRPGVEISLFEANDYYGGHTHTVDMLASTPKGVQSYPVDTGFLVFNERTYPHLIALFKELRIPTAPSDMSFSVQAPKDEFNNLEWSGTSINSVFAQRKNLLNLDFLCMLKDIIRFNALATSLATVASSSESNKPLLDFLIEHKFNSSFINWYLLPMLGCIWSCPPDQMLSFPVSTMVSFCHNHGLLQVSNRPRWFTVKGGAKQYVDIITNEIKRKYLNTPVLRLERDNGLIQVVTSRGRQEFDHVIIASHADQALRMLGDPSELERAVLGAFKFKDNTAVLHTDSTVLPRKRLAWAAWNFQSHALHDSALGKKLYPQGGATFPNVCLHYYLNKLQPLPFNEPVIVTLNPISEIEPKKIAATYSYAHPIFDLESTASQQKMHLIQGRLNTWYAGAWMGYGFHEDGHKAGLSAAKELLLKIESQGAVERRL